VKYVYLLRVTFEAPDDVAAVEEMALIGNHTSDRVHRALICAHPAARSGGEVSEKLQRVKDGEQPRLVRRYR
jgi:hypothetical protein